MKEPKERKKKTKRSKVKYPALDPRVNSRVRSEYIDFDYLDQLSDEEKQWLNDFSAEWLNAEVGRQDNASNNKFQNTAELVKQTTDANNARNRCLYGRTKNKVGATKLINYEDVLNVVEESLAGDLPSDYIEDAMIEYIDSKRDSDGGE